jgi:hypothetical protein
VRPYTPDMAEKTSALPGSPLAAVS